MLQLIGRIFWFIAAPFLYWDRNPLLVAIVFGIGFVVGLLTGFFGSTLFKWLTGVIVYILGQLTISGRDNSSIMATLVMGGYLSGLTARMFIAIF